MFLVSAYRVGTIFGCVALWEKREVHTEFWWGKPKVKYYLEHAVLDGRIIQGAYKLPEDFAKPYFHKY